MSKLLLALSVSVLCLGVCGGCRVESDGAPEVKVSDEAKDAGERIAEGTKDAVDKTGQAMSQAAMTGKITSALNSAGSLDIENLDVDTVGNTITLRGYVPNAEHKKTAEQLAKNMAGPEYTVVNDLAIKTAP